MLFVALYKAFTAGQPGGRPGGDARQVPACVPGSGHERPGPCAATATGPSVRAFAHGGGWETGGRERIGLSIYADRIHRGESVVKLTTTLKGGPRLALSRYTQPPPRLPKSA